MADLPSKNGNGSIDPLAQTAARVDPLTATAAVVDANAATVLPAPASPVPAGVDALAATAAPPSGGVARPSTQTVVSVAAVDVLANTVASAPSSEVAVATGTVIGRYRILNRLGGGAMGEVYAASDEQLDRNVAIKLLKAKLRDADPEAQKRFAHEAQAMAKVTNPNVVSVHELGTYGEGNFIAMELVDGESLRTWQTRNARSLAEIVEVYVAAGQGLAAAHDAGIVHGDFKPDNVLVTASGRPLVTDFGLARFNVLGTDVNKGLIAGSPAYMPPEQHDGGNLDGRSDQFSFAVSLYEAIVGTRPFAGNSVAELSTAVRSQRIEPVPTKVTLPGSLEQILHKAMSPQPGDRYPTMRELLRVLGRDRTKRYRAIAKACVVAVALMLVALGADAVMRSRVKAVTRTGFDFAHKQVRKQFELRSDVFTAQAEAVLRSRAVEDLAAVHDQSDFGLGDVSDDQARLRSVHENLSSADWFRLAQTRGGDVLIMADYKARMIYNTAQPGLFGNDLAGVAQVAAAYDSKAESFVGIVEPATDVAAGKLLGTAVSSMYVMFAKTKRIDDKPRALFATIFDASRLIADVEPGNDWKLSIVAASGASVGSVPQAVVSAAQARGFSEVIVDGAQWYVERLPLPAPGQQQVLGDLIMGHTTTVGLTGLFPQARMALLAAIGATIACFVVCLIVIRKRDLRLIRRKTV